MSEIREETTRLVEVIRNSTVYAEYSAAKEELKKYPVLQAKVDEYRTRNFRLQQDAKADIFDGAEALQQTYVGIIEDPVAYRFLRAESAFCRVMQQINYTLLEELEFEIGMEPEEEEA